MKAHTIEKVYVTRDTLHDMESKLPENVFMRVHKSYIISLSKIESVSGNCVYINNQEIPVGEMYKLTLKQKIGN